VGASGRDGGREASWRKWLLNHNLKDEEPAAGHRRKGRENQERAELKCCRGCGLGREGRVGYRRPVGLGQRSPVFECSLQKRGHGVLRGMCRKFLVRADRGWEESKQIREYMEVLYTRPHPGHLACLLSYFLLIRSQ
jgi:hypothetical protein